ncbi:hypothetical protein GJA_2482 [Janthinobacterium agaricidamnosum NBRC 102515 = DSM 9628]|uniref:Uncharacterized protein n=1 Tax=Janthinobacterium agaricidamnosum NBRC 102515 = DSM 9628 TaxID=1349767 RepID=W0V6Y7_9BURK|nr:hypothetical protein GJA_2482 [Janthinobacterium agaricidamnosum NBRC 102515 = DSM 9628]
MIFCQGSRDGSTIAIPLLTEIFKQKQFALSLASTEMPHSSV